MPLSLNEIRARALAFSKEWEGESSEDAEAKSFWDAFFGVFGISRRRVATFEEPVRKSDGKGGFIDLLWRGKLLVEHKSKGKDLAKAFTQAKDYFEGLKDRDLPQYVLVSDFARFRLYDLDSSPTAPVAEFPLEELHKNIKHFGFISGYETRTFEKEDPVNIKAAEKLGVLHDELKSAGYEGHVLEVFLVRVLFCLFADDTNIFASSQFREFLEQRTAEDGSDLGGKLTELFQTLNTPPAMRQRNLDEHLAAFPYVNGLLFAEILPTTAFTADMREALLENCALDWSRISPAIFGSLFQSIMDKRTRRDLGAHYTRETNILKALRPLFLDALREEFGRIRTDAKRLAVFHKKLASIKIFDPACGCGNFLVIAYRELRTLELDVLRALQVGRSSGTLGFDLSHIVSVDVDQFYGIEIEEFPAQIAQVALWMTDHQMNMRVSEEFGEYFVRLPLKKAPNIVHANALRTPWASVVRPEDLTYIVGNPPFKGHHLQSEAEKADMVAALDNDAGAGVLDYVTAWFSLAAAYIRGTRIRVAFVATNSIAQGEQVGILWRILLAKTPLEINFAHRTFKWSNEARGQAAVYCVIVGFSVEAALQREVYDYETPTAEPVRLPVSRLNAYLVDAPWVLLQNRSSNPFGMPEMMYGSKPTDGGHFLFTDDERIAFLAAEPDAAKYVKPFMSAHEYLHGERRWALWLVGAKPEDVRGLPKVRERVEAVDRFRKGSKAESTRRYPYPMLFRQITQPKDKYILIPRHSSENRRYIPFGFFDATHIVADSCLSLPGASLYHFGVIQSGMHMAWMRYTCGRLKGDYRYSKDIVYNNFPWPSPNEKQRAAIEDSAKAVLAAREGFASTTLSDLYDPLSMPPALVKAHVELDKAVDTAYGKRDFKSEAERVALLFELYERATAPMTAAMGSSKSSKRALTVKSKK